MGRPIGSTRHLRIGNLKWCFVCQQYKDIGQFCRNKSKPDGLNDVCKACRTDYEKDYQHQYYLRHRDELLPKHRMSAIKSLRRKS